jgi:hypothetical protein
MREASQEKLMAELFSRLLLLPIKKSTIAVGKSRTGAVEESRMEAEDEIGGMQTMERSH